MELLWDIEKCRKWRLMNPVQLAGIGLGAGHVPDKKQILEGVYRRAYCGCRIQLATLGINM